MQSTLLVSENETRTQATAVGALIKSHSCHSSSPSSGAMPLSDSPLFHSTIGLTVCVITNSSLTLTLTFSNYWHIRIMASSEKCSVPLLLATSAHILFPCVSYEQSCHFPNCNVVTATSWVQFRGEISNTFQNINTTRPCMLDMHQ